MKKVLLTSIVLLTCYLQTYAQKYLNIYQDNLVINRILATEVDSINVTDKEPYTINIWSGDKVLVSYASEEVDSMKVIDEKGGPLSYLGIVGFNHDLYTKNVALLSNSTVSQYTNFIKNLTMKNSTVLYYAVDNALNLLERSNIKTQLSSINFITFTDGLDLGSIMKNSKYDTSNSYLEAVSKRIKESKYNGQKVDAYAIGLRGNDVTDTVLFKHNLKSLASSEQNAFELKNINQLDSRLQDIANRIININTRQTVRVQITGIDNGSLIRFIFDGKDIENSQLYIEGKFNKSDYSLYDVTYHGMKARSGSIVQGMQDEKVDTHINFTFRGLHLENGDEAMPTNAVQHYYRFPNSSEWQKNTEIEIDKTTQRIVSYTGTAIVLVLDCSNSLGNDFSKMKEYATSFIKKVSKNAMPFTFESPKKPKATMNDTDFSITVSWDVVVGANYYKVYRSSKSNSGFELVADNVRLTTWKDRQPMSGNNYYQVCAVGLGLTTGMSTASDPVNCSLDAPKNVKGEVVLDNGELAINVKWDEVKHAEYYQVYRSNSSSSNFKLIGDAVSTNSYLDLSPLSGSNYYKVRAVGHGMTSNDSNSSAEVKKSMPTPANVAAQLVQDGDNLAIKVTWDEVKIAEKYILYRSHEDDWGFVPVDSVTTNSWTDKSPLSGNNYYKVSAKGYGLESSKSSVSNSVKCSLDAPSNAKAALDDTEFVIQVTWDAVSNANYYQVYRSPGNSTSGYELIADNITECSWKDNSPKVSYNNVYYKIYAVSGSVISSASSETSVYCSLDAPGNVEGEIVINNNELAINIKWDAVKYAECYQVYRRKNGGYYSSYELVADSLKSNSYIDIPPSSGTDYYYKVRALGHGLESSNSDMSGAISYSMPTPSNVAGELVVNGNNIAISVTWDAVNIAEKYKIYRSRSSWETFELVDSVTTNSWIDKSPLEDTNYYKVVAVGHGLKSNESNYSNEIRLSMPIPTNVTSELVLDGNNLAITVTWDEIKIAEKYQIYRSDNYRDFNSDPIADNVTTNSWIDKEPKVGSNYYKVVAVGYELVSNMSEYSATSCSLDSPKNVSGELVLNGNIFVVNLAWDTVKFAEYYRIYRKTESNSYYSSGYTLIKDSVKSTTWVDDSPQKGNNYYKVCAFGHGLTSEYSNNSNVVNCVLPTPENVSGELVANGNELAIKVTWDAVANAESYNVYRSDYNGDYTIVAENITTLSWTDNLVSIEQKYYYKIEAKGHGLMSYLSDFCEMYCSLPAPKNVSGELAVSGDKLGIKVTWDAIALADKYKVYRSEGWSGYTLVAENITSNSWTDVTLRDGYSYSYKVEAIGHGSTSEQSSSSSSVEYALGTPNNVRGELILSNNKQVASITWDAVDFAQSYDVYRCNRRSGSYTLVAEDVTSNSWRDESPMDGSNYYKVTAKGYGLTSQQSSYSNEVNK